MNRNKLDLKRVDECVCGYWLSTRQKQCPRCKESNPDYKTRWMEQKSLEEVNKIKKELEEETLNKIE